MAEHENSIGESDEWYTPPDIFDALGCVFDLDPCSPNQDHWVPAKKRYTKEDDGLSLPWGGFVFMNPPFGGRNGHIPWLEEFIKNGNGIAILRSYTSSAWWHEYVVPNIDYFIFPKGKTKFIKPDGSVGKSPGHGIALLGIGEKAKKHMKDSGIGWYVDNTAKA